MIINDIILHHSEMAALRLITFAVTRRQKSTEMAALKLITFTANARVQIVMAALKLITRQMPAPRVQAANAR